jgi:hypothetical protein
MMRKLSQDGLDLTPEKYDICKSAVFQILVRYL